MNKKGISDVVANVLIVLIVIITVGLVWMFILPFITDRLSSVCSDVDVTIDSSSGYTCLDTNQSIMLVQVKKCPTNVNISALKFYIDAGGNSEPYEQEGTLAPSSTKVVPLSTTGLVDITKIRLVSVVSNGKTKKDCAASSLDQIPLCTSEVLDAYGALYSSDLPPNPVSPGDVDNLQ